MCISSTRHSKKHVAQNCLSLSKCWEERSRSSKDGSSLSPPPQNSAEPWFCGRFHIVLKKTPVEELFFRTTKVLQNVGSQAQLFRPCKFVSQMWLPFIFPINLGFYSCTSSSHVLLLSNTRPSNHMPNHRHKQFIVRSLSYRSLGAL